MSEPDPAPPRSLEAALSYSFRDPGLLELALSHPSYSQERDGSRGNERLEYLGDAVLGLVVAHLLCDAHPDWQEGDLTRARAALVNKRALAARARSLDLGDFLRLGRTEQRSDGAQKESVLANGLEALFGALYLDGGLSAVRESARQLFGEAIAEAPARDAKTELQEWAHATFGSTPSYRTVGDSGTEDDAERFRVEVRIDGQVWGSGVGRSKHRAELDAARGALARRRDA